MGARPGRGAALLALGFLLGGGSSYLRLQAGLAACSASLARTRAEMRTVTAENRRLEEALDRYNRRRAQGLVIRTVHLRLSQSPLKTPEVKTALGPYLQPLLGTPLAAVQPELVYRLLAGRILTAGAAAYRLEVEAVLLAPETVVLARVVPLNGRPGPG